MPYSIAEPALQRWHEYVDALHALLAEDRRSDAFELFMRMAGASDDMVARGEELAGVARMRSNRANARL